MHYFDNATFQPNKHSSKNKNCCKSSSTNDDLQQLVSLFVQSKNPHKMCGLSVNSEEDYCFILVFTAIQNSFFARLISFAKEQGRILY